MNNPSSQDNMVRGGDLESVRSAGSSRLRRLVHRLRRDERGEGVISAAIAVLVMAFIGVGAFVAYKAIMGDVTKKTQDCVSAYVSDAGQCGNA